MPESSSLELITGPTHLRQLFFSSTLHPQAGSRNPETLPPVTSCEPRVQPGRSLEITPQSAKPSSQPPIRPRRWKRASVRIFKLTFAAEEEIRTVRFPTQPSQFSPV